MTISSLNNDIKSISHSITECEKKITDKEKEIDKANLNIASLQTQLISCTKDSSAKTLQQKIKTEQNNLKRYINSKQNLQKQLATYKSRLSTKTTNLRKEEAAQRKTSDIKQQKLIKSYENKISSMQDTIEELLAPVAASIAEGSQSGEVSQYDVFISYASEDTDYVDTLTAEMKKLGIEVWRDTLSIGWGDSIRDKIDKGLLNSQFAVVVLSKNYMGKYWTKYEFDGILNLETTTRKVFLPIWHNVTLEEVKAFSPSISGRRAFITEDVTPSFIAKKFKELLEQVEKECQEQRNDDV